MFGHFTTGFAESGFPMQYLPSRTTFDNKQRAARCIIFAHVNLDQKKGVISCSLSVAPVDTVDQFGISWLWGGGVGGRVPPCCDQPEYISCQPLTLIERQPEGKGGAVGEVGVGGEGERVGGWEGAEGVCSSWEGLDAAVPSSMQHRPRAVVQCTAGVQQMRKLVLLHKYFHQIWTLSKLKYVTCSRYYKKRFWINMNNMIIWSS